MSNDQHEGSQLPPWDGKAQDRTPWQTSIENSTAPPKGKSSSMDQEASSQPSGPPRGSLQQAPPLTYTLTIQVKLERSPSPPIHGLPRRGQRLDVDWPGYVVFVGDQIVLPPTRRLMEAIRSGYNLEDVHLLLRQLREKGINPEWVTYEEIPVEAGREPWNEEEISR